MKNLIFFLLIPFSIFSQEISIKSKMDITDFEKAVSSFEGYVYYNFEFISDDNSKINFEIIEKEFVDGKVTHEKVYFDSKTVPSTLKSSVIPVTVLSKSISNDNYKLLYQFYEIFNLNRIFDLQEEDRYDLKLFINESQKFNSKTTYLLSAIVKPIKISENTYRYCDFASVMDKYDQWFEIFGLDRYFIYEVKFY